MTTQLSRFIHNDTTVACSRCLDGPFSCVPPSLWSTRLENVDRSLKLPCFYSRRVVRVHCSYTASAAAAAASNAAKLKLFQIRQLELLQAAFKLWSSYFGHRRRSCFQLNPRPVAPERFSDLSQPPSGQAATTGVFPSPPSCSPSFWPRIEFRIPSARRFLSWNFELKFCQPALSHFFGDGERLGKKTRLVVYHRQIRLLLLFAAIIQKRGRTSIV